MLVTRAPESRLCHGGSCSIDRFFLFVKLAHGTDDVTKHAGHAGPVALGECFEQLILVLTEADPQNSTSPLQFPPLPRSVLLM